jgi:hypothetical protein
MMYRVTRTYADNCDVIAEFDNEQEANEYYMSAVRDNKGVALIKMVEIDPFA